MIIGYAKLEEKVNHMAFHNGHKPKKMYDDN